MIIKPLAVVFALGNVVASAAPVLDFVKPTPAATIVSQGATLDPAPRTATGNLRQVAVTFAPGARPALLAKPGSGAWNWAGNGELSLQVQNGMPWPVTLVVDIAGQGHDHLEATVGVMPGPPQTLIVPLAATSPRAYGMQVGPPMPFDGKLVATHVDGKVDLAHVASVSFAMPGPGAPQTLLLGAMQVLPGQANLKAAYTGIVDGYGQASRGSWPEKIASDVDLRKAVTAAAPATSRHADTYGGAAQPVGLDRTGWFHTQKADGRWMLVTPDGHAFFSLGVNAISRDGDRTFTAVRPWMFRDLPPKSGATAAFYGTADSRSDAGSQRDNGLNHGDWFDFYTANIARARGTDWLAGWRKATVDRLLGWGFNTIGNWSDPVLTQSHRIAYTVPVNIEGDFATVSTGYDYWGRMPDPFDPRFVVAAEKAVTAAIRGVRDDPWLLGYFADNELAWAGVGPQGRWGLAAGSLALDGRSPAKHAFVAMLRKKYGDAARWSSAWGVSARSWDQLLATPLKAPDPSEAKPAIAVDYIAFLKLYADTYFNTVATSLKKHDPHHLFLGGRLAVRTPEVEDACARYCDVVSINMYTDLPEHGFDVAGFKRRDKPVLISEFHFGSADRGPFGNGVAAVGSEGERGKAYARFVDAAVASGVVVGTHWFDYVDQPASGRILDGENSHIGLVGITDVPFAGFVDAVTRENAKVSGAPWISR